MFFNSHNEFYLLKNEGGKGVAFCSKPSEGKLRCFNLARERAWQCEGRCFDPLKHEREVVRVNVTLGDLVVKALAEFGDFSCILFYCML